MAQTGTSTSLRPISEIRLNPKNPRLIKIMHLMILSTSMHSPRRVHYKEAANSIIVNQKKRYLD